MSKRDRKQKKRKQRREQAVSARQQVRGSVRRSPNDTSQLNREIENIVAQAEARSAKIVTFGALVFFSTETGDAWMLDPEESCALPLAKDGERMAFALVKTGPAYEVGWSARFAIKGEGFVVTENAGRVLSIRGYPTDAILAHCRLALGSETETAPRRGSPIRRTRSSGSSRSGSGSIDWDLALRDVPSEDILEGLDLANIDHLEDAASNFCWMLCESTFAQWEAVIREEQGLPLSEAQQDRLNDLVHRSNGQDEDRILFVDESPRPREPWYTTLRRLAGALLVPVIRTDHDYCEAQLDGWVLVEDHLELYAEELSRPADARGPLDVLPPDIVHRLRLQSCLSHLVGIGQNFREGLTLANTQEQSRVDELLKHLREHRDSVEFLGLTLKRLAQLVELPPGEEDMLMDLLLARLGPLAPDEPLARRLPPGELANAASLEP